MHMTVKIFANVHQLMFLVLNSKARMDTYRI